MAVQADLRPGVTVGQVTEAVNNLPVMRNLPASVHPTPTGDVRRMEELFGGFAVAMATGIFMIFAVMVLLFKSFFKPVIILSALPLSIGGAFLGLILVGLDLTLPVLIGLLMLMGLAAKNSILLVEFAIEWENQGATMREAVLHACRERARPIIMTTFAMAAGMLPTALGIGEGASFRQPMAVAVIGGLISSTILSLILVPVVYEVVDRFERRVTPGLRKLITPRPPDDRTRLEIQTL
jgi:HAE1 family hydrophobic/amphiphilic exporter-1